MNKYFNQKGAVIVLFAVLLPLLMATTGLAIDIGSAYTQRSNLQNIADTAALAGGHKLSKPNDAKEWAQYCIDQNSDGKKLTSKFDFPSDNQFAVTLTQQLELVFLNNFIDEKNLTISVSATAEATTVSNNDSIFDYCMIHGDTNTSPNLDKSMDNYYYDKVVINSTINIGNWKDRGNPTSQLSGATLILNKKTYKSVSTLDNIQKFSNNNGTGLQFHQLFANNTNNNNTTYFSQMPDDPVDISLASNQRFIDNLSTDNSKILIVDPNKTYALENGKITDNQNAAILLWKSGGNGMNIANIIAAGYTGIYINNQPTPWGDGSLNISSNFSDANSNFSIVSENTISLQNINTLPIDSATGKPYQTFVCSKYGNIDLHFNNYGSFFAYAPNGQLTIRNGYTNYGSLVAKTINFEGGNHSFYNENLSSDFGSISSSNSSSISSVKLIK